MCRPPCQAWRKSHFVGWQAEDSGAVAAEELASEWLEVESEEPSISALQGTAHAHQGGAACA